MQTAKKILFVINPIAGGIDKLELETRIRLVCEQAYITPQFYFTTGNQDNEIIQFLINAEGPWNAVVAVGGDGTVNLVGKLLAGTNTPLGIIPFGSGNGLAKDLKIPIEFYQSLELIIKLESRPIDTLIVNGETCLHLGDLGFNALIVKAFNEDSGRGPTTYVKHALLEYFSYQAANYSIETESDRFEGKAFMVVFANTNMFGSNMFINPEGLPNDGYFEICIIENFPKTLGINILFEMYNESIHKSLHCTIFKCKKASILNPEKSFLQIDGEPHGAPDKIDIHILANNLKIIGYNPV